MTPVQQTFGYVSLRDLTNQCGKPCHWVLIERGMACCEFDRPDFPHAQTCPRFEDSATYDET